MSLRVLYSLCFWTLYIQQLQAGESILRSAECSDLFEQSVENPNNKTTSWSNNVGSSSRSSCSICNSRDSAKSWLVLKALPNNGYNVIHVSMKIKVTDCNVCKDQSIKAFIMHASVVKNLQFYKLLEDLPLVKNFPNKEQNVVNTADFKYALKGRKQFAVVLLSAGSCTEIERITISYYVCEKNTSTAMVLPRTIAPENGHQQVNTSCSPNTINPGNKQAYGLCSSEGKWMIVSLCMCKEGYTLDSLGGCKECQKNTYKDKAGNERCLPCPKNSISNDNQQRCTCEENHFRFIEENYTSPCYGIPTSVNELQYKDKDHESVTLLWKHPTSYESLSSKIVIYEVDCFECSSSRTSAPCIKACGPSVRFIPSKTDIESENVTIKDLKSNTEYEFVIYSKNEYNVNISRSHWARASKKLKTECEKNFYKEKAGNERCLPCPKNSITNDNQQRCTCEENHFRFIGENYTSPCYGIPTSVNELQYKDKDHESVTLLWKPPTLYESLSSKIVIYEVDCFECSSSRKSAPCIKACGPSVRFIPSKTDIESENVTIKDLKSNTEYEFVIYSKNEYNANISRSHWARASKKLKTDERERVASKSNDLPSFVVIVVPIIGLLMVVIIIILVICLCKRRKAKKYRACMLLEDRDKMCYSKDSNLTPQPDKPDHLH